VALYHVDQFAMDCNDLDRATAFWTEALGYEVEVREPEYSVLRDPKGREPKVFLQLVPEPKQGKNRAHLDIEVPDEAEAVARLTGLGATVRWRMDFKTHYWTVLADPDGNEFCVGRF
jgi:catechol 2,3-dioxygenase-like lactoylglutathione lyase family enzyme